jgi:lysophospholipase L1-like esterase
VDPNQDPLFKEQQQKDPEALFRSAIDDLCRVAASNHVKTVLLYLPTADELNVTNSVVLKVKREAHVKWNVPLVDITSEVQPLGKALYLESDPVHFNARGNEIIARRLFETVSNPAAP